MHYSTLYIREDINFKKEKEEEIARNIEKSFDDVFCDDCGEKDWEIYGNLICDWFQIGGRWGKLLKTKKNKGFTAEPHYSYFEDDKLTKEGKEYLSHTDKCDMCDIADLVEPIDKQQIAYVCLYDMFYEDGTPEYEEYIDKVNNKEIKGTIAIIDMHN